MFAALHLPDFPVAAALRNQPAARDFPCAILAVRGPRDPQEKLPLLSINRAARTAGIAPGWPLNRALVRCPDLRVIPRDLAAETALRDELVFLGESLTADVEMTAPDCVTLDLSCRTTPVGAALDGLSLAGAEIHHARADTPDLAHLAARHEATRGRVVTPADLAPLPLGVLGSLSQDPASLALLDLWGLRTLGDFMKLPRQALVERLGPEPGRWHDLLHGKSCRLLRLHRPPESFAQSFDFEDAAVSLDPVVFALKRLLHTLAGRLASRHLAASSLDFRLVLESGGELARRIRLPEPQAAVEGMLAPLQTLLESLRPDAPVAALQLDAETTFATAAQREWFGRYLPQPERWAETLAKLEALLGPGRVGIPAPPESFRPDSFTLHLAAVSAPPTHPDCPLPLHRFRPPREIAVAYESRDRQPWPMALLNGPHPGEITGRRGPFPASGAWWEPAGAWQRLEWDVQLAGGQLLRLVFQTPDRWTLEGIYR
jgi:protein ImuB